MCRDRPPSTTVHGLGWTHLLLRLLTQAQGFPRRGVVVQKKYVGPEKGQQYIRHLPVNRVQCTNVRTRSTDLGVTELLPSGTVLLSNPGDPRPDPSHVPRGLSPTERDTQRRSRLCLDDKWSVIRRSSSRSRTTNKQNVYLNKSEALTSGDPSRLRVGRFLPERCTRDM